MDIYFAGFLWVVLVVGRGELGVEYLVYGKFLLKEFRVGNAGGV